MGYHPFSVSSDMMVSNITFSQYALNYIGFMPDTSQKTLLEHDMGGFLASSIFLGICVSKKNNSPLLHTEIHFDKNMTYLF